MERISERVVGQIFDVAVPQGTDGIVEVVKRVWQERTQQHTVEEQVEVSIPKTQG